MALKYQHPFPKVPHYDEDDPFGNTSPPWRSPQSPHRGADYNKGIAEITGTPIPAVADGVVVFRGPAPGLGNMVTLEHSDGAFSGYCHQDVPSPLTLGQKVTRGSSVGGIGGTNGTSDPYAPHLHLTMGRDIAGTQGGASRFDPIPYIDARLDVDDTTPQKEDDMVRLIRIPINGQDGSGGWHWLVVDHGNHSYWNVPSTAMVTLLRNQGMIEVNGLQSPSIIDGYRNITAV